MTVAPAKPTQKFLDMQRKTHEKIADERDKALKKYINFNNMKIKKKLEMLSYKVETMKRFEILHV